MVLRRSSLPRQEIGVKKAARRFALATFPEYEEPESVNAGIRDSADGGDR
jgi:hypothetical protein